VSTYDKAKTAHYKALVLQRVDNDKLKCPCGLVDYCADASRTGDLLACELSDASLGIPQASSRGALFFDDEGWDYPTVGTVRIGGRNGAAT
jgi:hypothetical protein